MKYLTEEDKVFVTDINEEKLEEVSEKYGAKIIMGDRIYDMDMDIYIPVLLEKATLNTDTIHRLKCEII